MNPGSSTESYPAFAHIELRENPRKNLNQVTCPNRDSNPGHLVSRPDALTVTPQCKERLRMMMKVKKEEGETRCRHVAYSCRIAPTGPPVFTSPSDGRITINSDISMAENQTVLSPTFNKKEICVSLCFILADLVIDHLEIMRTAHLEDKQLYFLQCAMEENCLASAAYKLQSDNSANWHLETRRLLRFTARILNAGTADFRPMIPKHLWEFHQCHMCSANEKSALYRYIDYFRICNRKTISEKSRRLEIQYCRRRLLNNHNPRSEELTGSRQIHVEAELSHLFRIPRIPSVSFQGSPGLWQLCNVGTRGQDGIVRGVCVGSHKSNLVLPPLVAITATTLSGMLSTSLLDIHSNASPFLLQHGTQLDNGSWPHLPRPQSPVQFVPKVLNGIEIRTLCRPVQPVKIIVCIPTHSSRRNMGPTSIVQLSTMLQEVWRRIPVDILHKLVESMPDRVAAVIATRGGTTRFQRSKNSAQLLFGR
ncbi:hypothetical protein ANN_02442 [Periplaneta americana]|uniref:Uncharacterized protein n=1 Tax=Periplaneta americana TaxID=6978 RepID=A0ABQ8TYS8_PERAM|nr:hypothetical protein ANN_02442 [Periplaneta americana]